MSREDIFRVRMFREKEYSRQVCGSCRAHFWSKPRRLDCGDTPCTDYYFDEVPLKSPPLSLSEVREKFLKFFQERGHEVIDPYPVVARWREDIYLTIASIAVFQPHVTKMIIQPPANPLVIAQPCVRLEDLGSVGYTLGRHLTNFIMGGHHAFNYSDRYVYFTDETTELATEFFTKYVGVPEDELSFKESWWEGGGNAGPCFEVSVGGLEVATLVFMMYDVADGKYVEMPLKIVDTGYGIERIAWLTQKTPTAFHAIYGDLVSTYHKIMDIEEPPKEVLRAVFKKAGKLDLRDPNQFESLKKLVSYELRIPEGEISKHLDGAVLVYNALDHVKTALLMLSDGVVPSNSGEGYLARLVLRKVFRILVKLGVSVDSVLKMFELQTLAWRNFHPRVGSAWNYVQEVVELEYKKFQELVDRAPSIVKKYLSRGTPGLSLEDYVELHESHGLPPELVAEVSLKLGQKVYIPREIYSALASKRIRAPIKKAEVLPIPVEVVKRVEKLPAAEKLFHVDSYIREFKARVIDVIGDYIVLDRTAFYPEGGGQKADRGRIRVGSKNYEVIDVQKIGDVVLHKVRPEPQDISVGLEVYGEIDWNVRYSHMRHHTATHILLGVLRKIYGDHIWQAGAEKEVAKGRLDVTHFKLPTAEEIKLIEREVNRIINEARPVVFKVMPKYDAERVYGFKLYQGGVPLEPLIRVVEVSGIDAEACFGTHLRNTAEVGGFKLINVEKIQDGVIRFEYVAGPQLVEYAHQLEEKINSAEKLVGGELLERLPRFLRELEDVRKTLQKYREFYRNSLVSDIVKRREAISENCSVSIIATEIIDEKLSAEVLKDYVEENPATVIALISIEPKRTHIEISEGARASSRVDAVDLVNRIAEIVGGKGGGKRDHAVLVLNRSIQDSEVNEVRRVILERVRELCSTP
ncbi:MAG: alanine--tRNA ligase [Sulfolobales archaeon]|nr:alanine--tRNA ligase [Sulfolobales archaeon]MDW8083356.1 alanine--tRNA ligase [Sulfolobales archaeon]